VIFRQFIHDDLGCASYLVGDEQAEVAAVVDPRLEVEEYLSVAAFLGVQIGHVLETHNHADHVSGHGCLASATGATIHIHELAQAQYEHEPLADGWELELGSVLVRAIHTPGHRPEHTAFALVDRSRGSSAWAVLSGDSLFVGDVARPDLAVESEEGARLMFRSLHERLLALPDTCEVWPGHIGGSLCGGAGMNLKVCSTIGFERAHSSLLQVADEEDFVARATAGLAAQPPNFHAVVAANRGRLRTTRVTPAPLSHDEVVGRWRRGALVVDTRSDTEFDAAHFPGALCIPARAAGFGTKLGWLAGDADEVILAGSDDASGAAAVRLAAAAGVESATAYMAGGMSSWLAAGHCTESIARITVPELRERHEHLQVLDVRTQAEWEEGFIPGSVHTPYHAIAGVPAGIEPAAPVAVVCGSGQRSATAASVLRRHGVRNVLHVADGGIPAWRRHGWPLEFPKT
jgi:glyoxylase-like metal-dependent hydrolase (beta-lactamase superfamily II)/rhodanese-related sulfurtransferase